MTLPFWLRPQQPTNGVFPWAHRVLCAVPGALLQRWAGRRAGLYGGLAARAVVIIGVKAAWYVGPVKCVLGSSGSLGSLRRIFLCGKILVGLSGQTLACLTLFCKKKVRQPGVGFGALDKLGVGSPIDTTRIPYLVVQRNIAFSLFTACLVRKRPTNPGVGLLHYRTV